MQQINLFIRSLIFSIFFITLVFLYSFICLASLLFSLSVRYKALRLFSRIYLLALKYICRIDYKIEGLENIPPHRVGVVLCKHQSAWETLCLPLYFNEPAVIAKRELVWIPFFGWGLAASDPILINRKNKSSAMQQIIEKGSRALNDGRWIMVFPEGTRIPFGQIGKYHLGGARLAVATHVPVVPVAHNAGYFWPRRGFIKRPGTITVVVGPVIETTGRTPEEVMALTKDWIETTVARISSFVNKPAS